MKHRWAFAALALALAVSLGAAAWQYRERAALQAQMTAARQRALLQLTGALGDLQIRIEKLLIASSPAQTVSLLGEIAQRAQAAQGGIAQLPLRHTAVSSASKLAGQMGDYALSLSGDVAGGAMLTDTDIAQWEAMLAACAGLNGEIAGLGDVLAHEDLIAPDGQMWADTGDDAPRLEALSGEESGIEYPTLIYDGPFSDGRHDTEPKGVTGEQITLEEAMERARAFVGEDRVLDVRATADSGGAIPAYGLAVDTREDGTLDVQIAKTGGAVLWMMPETAAYAQGLRVDECALKAYEFLSSRGYGHMEPNYWQLYNGLAVVNFAAVQDGVLLYPDLVKVQVRADTGAIVGLESNNYLMNHTQRDLTAPALSEEEARMRVSARLQVERTRLCVIPLQQEERLCYEFTGTFGDGRYLVYIDANTGEELEILKQIDAQSAKLTA